MTLGCARQPVHHAPSRDTADSHHSKHDNAPLPEGTAARKPAPSDCACLPSRFRQTGMASWYGKEFHGRRTASGERFDAMAMTAAHRTLPLGSYVKVVCAKSKKSIVVRINDRGPFRRTRIIDLSYAAATALGIQHAGTAKVEIERIAAPANAGSTKRRLS
ncbi:septal ring lytic transglycosylase RlpA family protein [Paraburkholderia sp. J41]|uniref:septal ring lytic transglycosylase RlpA family protein n=1 Tax=Paraburkholderia sp. J41 TaxID=2805433 RepID=UPI0039F6244A